MSYRLAACNKSPRLFEPLKLLLEVSIPRVKSSLCTRNYRNLRTESTGTALIPRRMSQIVCHSRVSNSSSVQLLSSKAGDLLLFNHTISKTNSVGNLCRSLQSLFFLMSKYWCQTLFFFIWRRHACCVQKIHLLINHYIFPCASLITIPSNQRCLHVPSFSIFAERSNLFANTPQVAWNRNPSEHLCEGPRPSGKPLLFLPR